MKRYIHHIYLSVSGFFIGIFRGKARKNAWLKAHGNKSSRVNLFLDEVVLDDFELQAFHRN